MEDGWKHLLVILQRKFFLLSFGLGILDLELAKKGLTTRKRRLSPLFDGFSNGLRNSWNSQADAFKAFLIDKGRYVVDNSVGHADN